MKRFAAWLRHWWVAVAAFVVGVLVLVVSWFAQERMSSDAAAWWGSVLTNVGAAVLLVAPIAWASERLTRQVETVREDVEETRNETAAVRDDVQRIRDETAEQVEGLRQEVATLRDLGDRLRDLREAETGRETAAYRRIGLDGTVPTREEMVAALALADRNGVVDPRHGPRAAIWPGQGVYLRLRYVEADYDGPDLAFEIMSEGGNVLRIVAWNEGVPLEDAILGVGTALRLEGMDPGFDATDWLRRISETLTVGASRPTAHRIVELHQPQWAVTTRGVVSYSGELCDLSPDEFDDGFAREQVEREPWADHQSLDSAIRAWKELNPPPDSAWPSTF